MFLFLLYIYILIYKNVVVVVCLFVFAPVMKKMVDRFAEGGRFLRVDLYLFVFLKFLSAVLPHISYDNTFEIG